MRSPQQFQCGKLLPWDHPKNFSVESCWHHLAKSRESGSSSKQLLIRVFRLKIYLVSVWLTDLFSSLSSNCKSSTSLDLTRDLETALCSSPNPAHPLPIYNLVSTPSTDYGRTEIALHCLCHCTTCAWRGQLATGWWTRSGNGCLLNRADKFSS